MKVYKTIVAHPTNAGLMYGSMLAGWSDPVWVVSNPRECPGSDFEYISENTGLGLHPGEYAELDENGNIT